MHLIPSFPDFCKFQLKHIDSYQTVYSQLQPFCDLSLNDLIIWFDHNNDLEISRLEGNFVLRFSNVFDDNRTNFVIVGKDQADATLDRLFGFLSQHHYAPEVTNTSSDFVDALSEQAKQRLSIEDEPENKDYIFDVAKNIELKGGKFEKLRYKINYFTQHYGDKVKIEDISLAEDSNKKKIINALHTWDRLYAKNQELKIKYEGVAINRHLLLASEVPVYCIAVSVDGKLIGFSIYHRPPQQNYIIGNHIKCDYSFRYIFDYMYYATMLSCKRKGIAYINGEQDLGDEGIRKHKQEMIPTFFLHRYTIRPKVAS